MEHQEQNEDFKQELYNSIQYYLEWTLWFWRRVIYIQTVGYIFTILFYYRDITTFLMQVMEQNWLIRQLFQLADIALILSISTGIVTGMKYLIWYQTVPPPPLPQNQNQKQN